jgi:hypothetical protein
MKIAVVSRGIFCKKNLMPNAAGQYLLQRGGSQLFLKTKADAYNIRQTVPGPELFPLFTRQFKSDCQPRFLWWVYQFFQYRKNSLYFIAVFCHLFFQLFQL